jgi:anti-sigma B factor antagonist
MYIDSPLTFDQKDGRTPGTRIFSLTGPLTLRNFFDFQAALLSQPEPEFTVLDLSGVPYMDSAGMGLVVNYYVHCQRLGTKVLVAGVGYRLMELFKLTKVDSVIPCRETYDAAEYEA